MYIFHFVFQSCSPTPWRDAWRELERLYREGAIQAIGVSNFSANLLRELLEMAVVTPAAVQNWMDPFHQDRDVRALCSENGELWYLYFTYCSDDGAGIRLGCTFFLAPSSRYPTKLFFCFSFFAEFFLRIIMLFPLESVPVLGGGHPAVLLRGKSL